MSGIYEFELWGSPGGMGNSKFKENGEMVKIPGGKGGYTKFYIHLDASTGLYCFVGGSGNAAEGKETAGGWNGGGSVIKCGEGLHAGSGGGMTHVSYTNNPASDSNGESVLYWNPDGTIGVAGGGGGSGRSYHRIEDKAFGGYGGGEVAGNGIYSHTLNYKQKHEPLGATQTTGYKQGIGEPNYNSGGGGGGWYGGYSTGHTKSTQGVHAGLAAAVVQVIFVKLESRPNIHTLMNVLQETILVSQPSRQQQYPLMVIMGDI